MFDDPIVNEVRNTRRNISKHHHDDVHELFQHWRSMERKRDKDNRLIEIHSAVSFLQLYNEWMNTQFTISLWEDHPDFVCVDQNGHQLNLEITLTQDRNGDIPALLGASDSRKPENVIGKPGSCLHGNVLDSLIEVIAKKLNKRYGDNTVLVILDSSPLGWDWDFTYDDIKTRIDSILFSSNIQKEKIQTPFERGIWILNDTKTKIYPIYGCDLHQHTG